MAKADKPFTSKVDAQKASLQLMEKQAKKPVKEKRATDMTIFEAKNKARELSSQHKDKKVYVVVNIADGGCGPSYNPTVPGHETHFCYRNGSEIAVDAVHYKQMKTEPKTKNETSTKTKSTMKNAVKTAGKTKAVKPAKKTAVKKVEGKKQMMSIKNILKAVASGKRVVNVKHGHPVRPKYLKKIVNQEIEYEVAVS